MIDYHLVLGDCLEHMRSMPDGFVDVVFTSPPYNDSGKSERDRETNRHFKYETVENREDWLDWQSECIGEMIRVCKRQVLYNIQPILNNKADVYKLIGRYADKIDNIIVWYKPNAQPQHYEHRIANAYELLIIFKGKEFDKLYINSNGYRNVIVKNINSNTKWSDKHRAVMSKDFCDEVIREFTLPTDTVLDPFMGLATTGISCTKYGRNFQGIEIYKPYYDIATQRMKDENAQINIWDTINALDS